ncbi:MAG: cyclic nucleotide-binding domain-containing protein [Alphaproteobacteria bacterium]|nr:cyclic nucleotide-binding domain-containing protein [Alphaproteobacteria bacterium]
MAEFTKTKVANGTVLFKEGDKGDEAYLIISGQIQLRKNVLSEYPQNVATLGSGDVVGEMALFDNRPRLAEAMVSEDAEVFIIPRGEFSERLAGMNPVMRRILQIMVARVRKMTDEFMQRKQRATWGDDWKRK